MKADLVPIPGQTSGAVAVADDDRSDDVVARVRELLAIGRLKTAKGLVERALRRFPDHAELGKLSRFLDQRGATPNTTVESTTDDEIDWLANPPENARGRWVALIGRQVVAMADSIRELKQALQSLDLPQAPLVHHIVR
jgi:hypothetical protein